MTKMIAGSTALLILLSGCVKRTEPDWVTPTRSAHECHADMTNKPCVILDQGGRTATLHQKDQRARTVRIIWHNPDGTWKFVDDLSS